MASTNFTDLLIHIFPGSDSQSPYRVDATISDGSFFYGHFSLDPKALLQKQLDPEGYGRALCEALFTGPIGQAHERAVALAQARSEGRLRVRLWIDEDEPELQSLPWERLYHHRTKTLTPFSLIKDTPFSRYVGLGIPEPQPMTTDEVHILVAISNPSDLEQYSLSKIDIKTEVKALHEALRDLPQVRVTIMPGYNAKLAEVKKGLDQRFSLVQGPTNLQRIKELLTTPPSTHVFHFLGHGELEEETGKAILLLEKEDGTADIVDGADLVTEFQTLSPKPALVFLAACDSATGDPKHSFKGLGPRLVHDAEIPAVIAMQGKVEMELAKKLTGCFYNRLLLHGVVDLALNEARSEVFKPNATGGGWDIPVLFMRLQTGQLFVPDPIRAALEAMSCDPMFGLFSSGAYLDLPIEAIRLTANQQDYSPVWSEPEATAAVYLVSATNEIFSRNTPQPRLVALIGGPGTNKSTQLKYIAWRTIKQSLKPTKGQATQVLPVYVDLRQFEPVASGQPIEMLILKSLRQFWPDLKASRLTNLPSKLTLRVLLDHSEDLTEQAQDLAWGYVAKLMASEKQKHHQYVLSSDPGSFTSEIFAEEGIDVHRLLIQPLSQRKMRHFLLRKLPHRDDDDQVSEELLKALNESQLFDLLSMPALMVRVVDRARNGDCPKSRVDVMEHWVGDAISDIPAGQGMRLHAPYLLSMLAWQMQSARATTWPVNLAFQTMAEIRGNREYSRETLIQELVRVGLLARVGSASLRFADPPLQAYCCALAIRNMPDRDRVLRDITATFDRHVQLRWWEETFVFLTGLVARNPDALRKLLDCIINGVNLLEQEHVFLAARCLLECEQCRIGRKVSRKNPASQPEFVCDALDQICQALLWRSDSANEPDMMVRIRAIRSLGQFANPAMALDLGRIAYNQVRKNLRGESDYDYSSVRMAAAIALQRLEGTEARARLMAIDAPLVKLYEEWLAHEMEAIRDTLAAKEEDPNVRSLAALALGDLLSEMEEVDDVEGQAPITTPKPRHLADLEAIFLDLETPEPVRWAVTHALAMLNVPVVTKRLLDSVQGPDDPRDSNAWRIQLYKCMAYLIGRTRSQIPEAHQFLIGPCFRRYNDALLWACAIEAIGWLSNRSDKRLLENIASNTYDGKQLDEYFKDTLEPDLLRRTAIQALRSTGDLETVHMLQRKRRDEWNKDFRWSSEMIRTFYKTCQEIYWRLDQEARGTRHIE